MHSIPKKTLTGSYRKYTHFAILCLLMAMLLQGCGGLLFSTLTDEEIRATAYDIATTRLATTIEIPPEAFQTLAPGQPTATLDPTYCPADVLAVWREAVLADFTILDQEMAIFIGDVYTPDQLTHMTQRAAGRSAVLQQEEEPRCAIKANKRMADLYDQFAAAIDTRLRGDLGALPEAKLRLQQALQKAMDAIREIVRGEEFKPFDEMFSRN